MPIRISRDDFMKHYVFPNEPACDFEQASIPAQFASGQPKDWSQAYHVVDLSIHLPHEGADAPRPSYTDVSSDKKLLAVSTSGERILIYHVVSRELRAVLEGAGAVRFRLLNIADDRDADMSQITRGNAVRPGYTLVSSIADAEDGDRRRLAQLMLWDSDQHGRLLDQEELIDSAALAKKAIDAIVPSLITNHEWTTDFINASNLHREFTKALGKAAINHRRRHNIAIKNAHICGVESTAISRLRLGCRY